MQILKFWLDVCLFLVWTCLANSLTHSLTHSLDLCDLLQDNGVKFVDVQGHMLVEDWEEVATSLANAK